MYDVIRAALDKLVESTKFGESIIEAQMLDLVSYAIYDGQQWRISNAQQATLKKPEMTISLPRLNNEKYQLFAAAYLDDQQDPGLFAECWQQSAAQWNCSNEMHMSLDILLQEHEQLNAINTATEARTTAVA